MTHEEREAWTGSRADWLKSVAGALFMLVAAWGWLVLLVAVAS